LKKYQYFILFFYLILSLFLTACSLSYKGMGVAMYGYAEDEGIPYTLATDDFIMSCSMSEAFTPFLLSFSRVTSPPNKLAILFYMMTGSCVELRSWEEELRYLRSIYVKNSLEAQDSRIASQRLLTLATRRQLKSYYSLVNAFVEPGGVCPEFNSAKDELYWLVGLMSGLKAVLNNISSPTNVVVPMDIAAKVERSSACLNNEKWWGIPEGIQAAVKIVMPSDYSVKEQAMLTLNHASLLAKKTGVTVVNVLAAQVYLGLGHIDKVKEIIKQSSKIKVETKNSQEFKILSKFADLQLLSISDRLWTQATGVRTPVGKLGTFWDDPELSVERIDINDIL